MENLMEAIKQNAEGNIYFFLSEEATAPNNSSVNLEEMVRKAYPVADTLGRHINIYGFNPEEGINFVCRVLPGKEVSDHKMVTDDPFAGTVTAADLSDEIVSLSMSDAKGSFTYASIDKADIKRIMLLAGLPELVDDMQAIGAIVTKPFHRKLRDKKVLEKESRREGFNPDNSAYTPDEEDEEDLSSLFGEDNNEVSFSLK
jgi:hypothetical protein